MDTFFDKITQKFSAQDMIKANAAAEAKETQRLREQVEEYEKLLNEMKQVNEKNVEVMERMMETIESMNRMSQQVDESVQSMSRASEAVNESVESMARTQEAVNETVQNINRASESVNESVQNMNQTTVAVNESVENMTRAQEAVNESVYSINQTSQRMSDSTQVINQSAQRVNELALNGCDTIRRAAEEMKENPVFEKEYIEGLFDKADESLHRENIKVYRNVQAVVNDGLKDQTEELNRSMDKTQWAVLALEKRVKLLGLIVGGLAAANLIIEILRMLKIF